jgi:hypothetical protein
MRETLAERILRIIVELCIVAVVLLIIGSAPPLDYSPILRFFASDYLLRPFAEISLLGIGESLAALPIIGLIRFLLLPQKEIEGIIGWGSRRKYAPLLLAVSLLSNWTSKPFILEVLPTISNLWVFHSISPIRLWLLVALIHYLVAFLALHETDLIPSLFSPTAKVKRFEPANRWVILV